MNPLAGRRSTVKANRVSFAATIRESIVPGRPHKSVVLPAIGEESEQDPSSFGGASLGGLQGDGAAAHGESSASLVAGDCAARMTEESVRASTASSTVRNSENSTIAASKAHSSIELSDMRGREELSKNDVTIPKYEDEEVGNMKTYHVNPFLPVRADADTMDEVTSHFIIEKMGLISRSNRKSALYDGLHICLRPAALPEHFLAEVKKVINIGFSS